MFAQISPLFLILALQATAAVIDNRQSTAACPKGVHVVGVRGTIEKPGFGQIKNIVDGVLEQVPRSDNYSIAYPATGLTIKDGGLPGVDPFEYRRSVAAGVANLSAEIKSFHKRCPRVPIVVIGYSQASIRPLHLTASFELTSLKFRGLRSLVIHFAGPAARGGPRLTRCRWNTRRPVNPPGVWL